MPRMTSRKIHPSGLKRWNGKFSTIFECILGNHYFPPHDQFGEFLVGFAHSTKPHVL